MSTNRLRNPKDKLIDQRCCRSDVTDEDLAGVRSNGSDLYRGVRPDPSARFKVAVPIKCSKLAMNESWEEDGRRVEDANAEVMQKQIDTTPS